ncbi:restriction endonuclease subunit S (plasmid) [Methylomonas sp. LL1]|uniref:restriction endonuclease subunit S n=1 Tax=Methylomonas sp. LL1 TaxID=2785785 RepID=UPI0018C38C66|nr:restriction endonuclease subunit S [Methylomonas sp. LL1]QPK61390.1 restriction endonuclease subunit S [Methylomonas sp. LL1]
MSEPTKKALVPVLRFPEFRDAGDWNNVPLESLYSFKVTNSYSRDQLNYENGSVKNIHYGDIHTKYSTLFNIEKEVVPFINPSEALEKIKPECYCVEGDMIFADASEDLEDVGKSIEVINLNNEKLLSGLHTLLARQKDKKLIIGFGGYLFKSNRIRMQIKKESQGAKVLGISAGRLSNIEVAFPSDKKEQQKIVDCLSSIDELVTAQTRKVEALKAYKKGLMQQLFPTEGATVPKLRFPEFRDAGEWKIRELKDFITERNQIPSEKLPLYSLTIEDGVTPKTERYERSFLVKDEKDAYKLAGPNDFAYNPMNLRFGAIGRHYGCQNIALSKYYNIFYCDETVDSRFCEIYFKSGEMLTHYDDVATGSLIEKRRVHFSSFLKIKIVFPNLSEQQRIADCLSSIDDLITAQTQKLAELKAHKNGLMQQLFPAVDEVNG